MTSGFATISSVTVLANLVYGASASAKIRNLHEPLWFAIRILFTILHGPETIRALVLPSEALATSSLIEIFVPISRVEISVQIAEIFGVVAENRI